MHVSRRFGNIGNRALKRSETRALAPKLEVWGIRERDFTRAHACKEHTYQ